MIKEPYVKITEDIVNYPSVGNLDETSILAGVIVSTYGPDHALVQGPNQFLSTFTADNALPRDADESLVNAYFCSFFAPLLLKRAWNNKVVLESNGSTLTSKSVTSLPNTTLSTGKIVAMKYPVDLISSTAPITYGAKWQVVLATLTGWNSTTGAYSYTNFNGSPFNFLATDFPDESGGTSVQMNNLLVVAWKDQLNEQSARYALVSLLPDGINPLTNDAIYWDDIINSNEDCPFIVDLAGFTIANTSIEFFQSSSPTTANYNTKFNSLANKILACKTEFSWFDEHSDIYNISYVSSLGLEDSSYAYTIASDCDKNKWFYCCDVDESVTITGSSGAYTVTGDLITYDTYRTMCVGSKDKNQSVTSWRALIAASSLYWQRVYSNKNANSEYAPVFDITNGVLGYQRPTIEYNKSQREALLSATYPINWVKYDRTNNVYYFNDNRTHTRRNNVMNEEMNVRMINRIQRDLALLLPQFKGQINNVKTREDVTQLIENYFNSTIMTQNYKPVEYKITCDRSNNTDAIINANKLAVLVEVRLQGSIKYIEVLNRIYPLGVEFER